MRLFADSSQLQLHSSSSACHAMQPSPVPLTVLRHALQWRVVCCASESYAVLHVVCRTASIATARSACAAIFIRAGMRCKATARAAQWRRAGTVVRCQVLLHPTHITVRKVTEGGLRHEPGCFQPLETRQNLQPRLGAEMSLDDRWARQHTDGSTLPTPSCIAQGSARRRLGFAPCRESIDPKLRSSGFHWQEPTSPPLSGE